MTLTLNYTHFIHVRFQLWHVGSSAGILQCNEFINEDKVNLITETDYF